LYKLHTTLKAWRSAGNSIRSAGTVVDFLFEVEDKIFLLIEFRRVDNCSVIVKQKLMLRIGCPHFAKLFVVRSFFVHLYHFAFYFFLNRYN
jgi:hypothetical protein